MCNGSLDSGNTRLEIGFLASGTKMISGTGTDSLLSIEAALPTVHARVRIASIRGIAPLTNPTRRALTDIAVGARLHTSTVHTALESTIRLNKLIQLELAVISDGSCGAHAFYVALGVDAATTVRSARVR